MIKISNFVEVKLLMTENARLREGQASLNSSHFAELVPFRGLTYMLCARHRANRKETKRGVLISRDQIWKSGDHLVNVLVVVYHFFT